MRPCEDALIRRLLVIVATTAVVTAAHAAMPVFAARCVPGLDVDTHPAGQVRLNGKHAKTVQRPDGQTTAHSAGARVDITPRGAQASHVTCTGKAPSCGTRDMLSVAAGDAKAAAPAARSPAGPSSSGRTGQDRFDARGDVPCAEAKGAPMRQFAFEAGKQGDVFRIRAGTVRHEIVDAVVYGG